MGIWYRCTKMFQRNKMPRESLFTTANDFQCEYTYAEVYLGAKAKAILTETKTEVVMSYSVRDGILVNIKRSEPYRVLFDYVDGTYLVNDDEGREYDQLVESLLCLKDEAGKHHHSVVYEKLEAILYKFLVVDFLK